MHRAKLNLDALAVDSFQTTATRADAAGTVHAHGGDAPEPTPPQHDACTCAYTCDCPSAYYWCGDGYHTIYSCDYTRNESCVISSVCPTPQ